MFTDYVNMEQMKNAIVFWFSSQYCPIFSAYFIGGPAFAFLEVFDTFSWNFRIENFIRGNTVGTLKFYGIQKAIWVKIPKLTNLSEKVPGSWPRFQQNASNKEPESTKHKIDSFFSSSYLLILQL